MDATAAVTGLVDVGGGGLVCTSAIKGNTFYGGTGFVLVYLVLSFAICCFGLYLGSFRCASLPLLALFSFSWVCCLLPWVWVWIGGRALWNPAGEDPGGQPGHRVPRPEGASRGRRLPRCKSSVAEVSPGGYLQPGSHFCFAVVLSWLTVVAVAPRCTGVPSAWYVFFSSMCSRFVCRIFAPPTIFFVLSSCSRS